MTRLVFVLSLLVGACSSGPAQQNPGDTAVRPTDATKVGPAGYQREPVQVDVGDRGAGLGSKLDVFLAQPRQTREAKAPFVIFVPEEGILKESYAYTASHLASWGYVVLVPQLATFSQSRTDAEQAGDLMKLVDVIEQGGLELKIDADPTKIAFAGHGRGARVALIAARRTDKAVAAFLLSPRDGDGVEGGVSVFPEQSSKLLFPIGIYGAARALQTADGQSGPCVSAKQSYRAIYPEVRGASVLIEAPSSGHGDLLESCIDGESDPMCSTVCVAGADPLNAINVARGAMAAFFGSHLYEDAGLSQFFDASFMSSLVPDVRVREHTAGAVDTDAIDTGLFDD